MKRILVIGIGCGGADSPAEQLSGIKVSETWVEDVKGFP